MSEPRKAVSRPGDDERRVRRAAAFACTRPLHRLEADKGQVQQVDLDPYPMDHLALDAIELVALHQAFQDGLTREEAMQLLASHIGRYAAERGSAEHLDVAQRILVELIAAHELLIPDVDDDGRLRQVVRTLRLLTEHQSPTGRIYLRAGTEAVNVLIDRLDVDASSSAHAAELQMQFLIRHGRMAEAQDVAHAMRLLSVHYMESTRRYLSAARRNLDEVDWQGDVERHLAEAHSHLRARIEAECAIDGELQAALDSGATTDRPAVMGALQLIKRTSSTHAELLEQLAGVFEVFRSEQDRQRFTNRVILARLADLRHDVLNGFMALTVQDASKLEPHPAQMILGAVVLPQVTVAGIVERTLASLDRPEPSDDPVEPIEYDEEEPDDSLRSELVGWLDPDVVDGRMLSEVLVEARQELDDDRLHRLAAIGMEAFGAEHLAVLGGAGEDADHASVPERFLIGMPSGDPLRVPGVPWIGGDDLRLVAATVANDDDRPAGSEER